MNGNTGLKMYEMEIAQLMKAWNLKELQGWKPCANKSIPETGFSFSGREITLS